MIVNIIIIIAALLLEGFFSGTETALVSCNEMRLRYKMEKGNPTARIIWGLLKNMHGVLATTLVGTNLCVVTGSIFAAELFINWFGETGPLIASCTMIPLILIFGEIIPKAIFRARANTMIFYTAHLLVFFKRLFFPIVFLIEGISSWIVKSFGVRHFRKDPFITMEDIELLVRQITREGVLERSEQGAIHQIFDFRYTRAGEIMVRLKDVFSIDFSDDRKNIIEKVRKHKFTRYPVLENRQIKGMINIFDILYNEGSWHKFIRPLKQVYANQRINQVLYQMQRNKELMSAVVRKGKLIGIVTLEDIIKEIELI